MLLKLSRAYDRSLLNDSTLTKDSTVSRQLRQEGRIADKVKVARLEDTENERYGLVQAIR